MKTEGIKGRGDWTAFLPLVFLIISSIVVEVLAFQGVRNLLFSLILTCIWFATIAPFVLGSAAGEHNA